MEGKAAVALFAFNPADHYWVRQDGRIYSSGRQEYVSDLCGEYEEWLSAGGIATPFPLDADGEESEDVLRVGLAKLGFAMFRNDEKPSERRERAYMSEVDAIREKVLSYQVEADGWILLGDAEKATAAVEKSESALREYVMGKERIRSRYPDSN